MREANLCFYETKPMEALNNQTALNPTFFMENEKNEELCAKWEARLTAIPWFDGNGHSVQELLQQKKIYHQAKGLMVDFKKTSFPVRICKSLENIARTMQTRIILFPHNLNKTAKIMAEELKYSIDQKNEIIEWSTEWESKSNLKKYLPNEAALMEITKQANELKLLFADDPAQIEPLLNALNRLKEQLKNMGFVSY